MSRLLKTMPDTQQRPKRDSRAPTACDEQYTCPQQSSDVVWMLHLCKHCVYRAGFQPAETTSPTDVRGLVSAVRPSSALFTPGRVQVRRNPLDLSYALKTQYTTLQLGCQCDYLVYIKKLHGAYVTATRSPLPPVPLNG